MIILYIQAIVLGLLEGITEFIPVSSTGHLLVFSELMHFNPPSKSLFIVVIQLGAILAVCYEYRKKLIDTLLGLCSNRKEENQKAWHFAFSIMLAFFPTLLVGAFLYEYIKHMFVSEYILLIVGFMLILGGFLLLIVEKHHKTFNIKNVDRVSLKQSFAIGCAQVFSMVPGVSRSGATIVGGLLSKLDRKTATEFSFFLAIPTMFAATIYDVYKNWSVIESSDFLLILVGFIFSYISALVIIRLAIDYLQKHSFRLFAYHRIAIGSLCIIYFILHNMIHAL